MKKVLLTLVVLVLVAALGAGFYLWRRDQHLTEFAKAPFGPPGTKVVLVPPGTGPKPLSTLLAREGIVSSAEDFFGWIRREKSAPRLKAGEYEFEGPLTPEQVVAKLSSGQQKLYHFTVPEGLRVDETLPILANSELHLNLQRLQELAADPNFVRKAGVPAPAKNLEGFLFPDTYSFSHGFTEESVLSKMVSRAIDEYKKADAHRKPGNKQNLLESMTLASIVEKETGVSTDRPRIACVFQNRLRLKMKLGTDPTVLYAMMLLRGRFIKNITKADLVTDHPYNTYTRYGLPPGPIASPGAAAINATLNSIDCTDLYFVSRNDGSSEFCPTLKCHNAAVQKWQVDYFHKKH